MITLSPINQDVLNISNKVRSNLFTWNGQFSPQLVEAILSTYTPPGSFVLDPFCGSGTVLCEAGRLGFKSLGCEINPSAIKISSIYRFINQSGDERNRTLSIMDNLLNESFPVNEGLFVEENPVDDYSKQVISLLSGTEGYCRSLIEALVILLDFYNNKIESQLIFNKWNQLKSVINNLPYSDEPIDILTCDARRIPIKDETIGFVFTSPPYINVFNYHQQYRSSSESLGWNLLKVARSEIGSNRKHRQNRFLTVIQYCLDMFEVFKELKRVCKKGSQIIFVVGRVSNVLKTPFFNGKILETLATRSLGWELPLKQERVFKNRFGEMIYEDILHFVNTGNGNIQTLLNPEEVAKQILEETIPHTNPDSLPYLYSALEQVDKVKTSPLFDPDSCCTDKK